MTSNLIQTAIEGFRRLFYLIPSSPEIAQIETTNKCNFNCAMCQRYHLKVPLENMDVSIYKKVVSKLIPIKEIILTGWGEPLMHPQLIEMISYAKSKGKKVSLTSNGSLLTKKMALDLINANLDTISFSIDEINPPKGTFVHQVTTQIKNIENFMKLLEENGRKTTVIIQSTLHLGSENKIVQVIKWAAKIKADMVNVNRLDMRFFPALKRPNLDSEKKFVEILDLAGKEYGIRTDFRPHIAFSGVSRTIYRWFAPYLALGGKHCLRIYNYVYINSAGQITPCCAIPMWPVGNLLKQDLASIWKNNNFNNFRKHDFQRKICGKCDVLEIKQWA